MVNSDKPSFADDDKEYGKKREKITNELEDIHKKKQELLNNIRFVHDCSTAEKYMLMQVLK